MSRARGGLATLVNRKLASQIRKISDSESYQVVACKIGHTELMIVNVYLKPSEIDFERSLEDLSCFLKKELSF